MNSSKVVRDPSQTVLSFTLNKELLEVLNTCVREHDLDRSKLIRRAIAEDLKRRGYSVDAALLSSPSRAGKGGRKPKPDTPKAIPTSSPSSAPAKPSRRKAA